MTQHTPGPWTAGWGCGLTGPTTPVLRPFCGHEWKFTPVSKGRETIAVCPAQESHDGDHAANARLIASSPRMYDYVAARAKGGDAEAAAILESIHA